MITLSILIVAIVLFAWKEAADDARAIAESNKTGKPFTHDDPDRYIVAGVFTLIMAGFAQTWWALLYFPITWAVFTISFRFLLNRMRGKNWLYVSPSNGYDWFYIRRVMNDARFSQDGFKEIHAFSYEHSKTYRWDIHRSGARAYVFEALVVLIPSVTIYILNITKTM